MRKGRGKNHGWQLVKLKGSMEIFAKCSCGFIYSVSEFGWDEDRRVTVKVDEKQMYRYCPSCGAKKRWYIDDVKELNKYWYER